MEIKKNEKLSVFRLKGLLFNLSLTFVLSLVIFAFEWKRYTTVSPLDFVHSEENFDPIIEIPRTEHLLPPPPPKIVAPKIVEVKNNDPLDDIPELEIDQNEWIPENLPAVPLPEESIETIYDFVETPASFPGGMEAFYQFVSKEIKYPTLAVRTGTEGKVYVQFVIDKDGAISQIEVMRGIGAGCDEEALRVLNKVPRFIPGKINGQPVKVRMRMPINFKLSH